MNALGQALRQFRRAPGFTAVVVLTLAIGLGATSAIFSVVNGVLLQPLPFPDADRLVALRHQSPGDDNRAASPALYFTYREHSRTLEYVALWTADKAAITGLGEPEEVRNIVATHDYLSVLGTQPALGRGFLEDDDLPGASPTVVLSHGYWQRRFGGAADAVERSLMIDGEPHMVIGVLPQSFRFLRDQAEILTPMRLRRDRAIFGPTGEQGIARLKRGVTVAQASADVARMIPIAREAFPLPAEFGAPAPRGAPAFGPNLQPLKDQIIGDLRDVLWVLMGMIVLLLTVACANVANLQLFGADARSSEFAVRAALGAGWFRIARGLLLESTALGLVGGAVGLVFAALGLPVLLVAAAEHVPTVLDVGIDSNVLLFVVGVSLASGLGFGIVPVLRHAAPQITPRLHSGGRASATRESQRASNLLVIAQVALALVLLVAAGLMIRTFLVLRDVDPGFAQPEEVQTVTLSVPQAYASEFARVIRMQNDIHERLRSIAGVESVGFASMVPLGGDGPDAGAALDEPDQRFVDFEFRFTSPGFFETLRTPLVAGRQFAWNDYYGDTQPVVVVSESFARRHWGSPQAALERRMRRTPASPWLEIVGVVGDIHLEGVDRAAPDTVYFTLRDEMAQWMSRTVTFLVRSERVGTPGFLAEIQRAVWSLNANLPLADVGTLGELYRQSMARTSTTLILLATTGAMALFLSLVGTYAVIAYVLARRTREMAVRMALGAKGATLKRMMVGHALMVVGMGVVIGLAGAAILTQLMRSLLFSVTSVDPLTYTAMAVALVISCAVAAYLPARRVTHIEPMQALRGE